MIYPNPNNGRFTIKTDLPIGKKDIAIFGVLGNELHFDLLQENMGFKVDLQKSYKGVLFVRIKTKDIDMVSKLIIE
ncbi:MAG: T9SS type A sorting domain-containing protein [Chlorobi bacterium]|nr:T9SS type A sorting domain-containing protein [Chlorobiota bacterium]